MPGGDESPRREGGSAGARAAGSRPAGADASNRPPPAVVALGASAGGIAALRSFFEHTPPDAGLAYVVVMHLASDRESRLDSVLQSSTTMPVRRATDDVELEPDHVYVIPPGQNLSSVDSHLRLTQIEAARRDRAPIDHFFRTLADTHDGAAVAVVLSGAGSDGALGLRTIKDRGGLTLVQDPEEAEFDGMPIAAVATGMADRVLRVHQMPEVIVGFARTVPDLDGVRARAAAKAGDELLDEVVAVVRTRTGRDFTVYKRAMLLRRIRRRMQVHRLTGAGPYLDMLRGDAEEVEQLADDFLVTVTEFFRDEAVFHELETRVVPRLFAGKDRFDAVRVWSVGCATGEEAYSLAILLHEHAATLREPPQLQVFATDVHAESLRRAREGRYPNTIAGSVTPERVERFFDPEGDWFRVRRTIRDTITFAPHNLFSDAPFSRLDLVVCRNVLIYLDRAIQADVIDLFHYALLPGAYLLLGPAESIEEPTGYAAEPPPRSLFRKLDAGRRSRRTPSFPIVESTYPGPAQPRPQRGPRVRGLGDLHREMLDELGPPSLLIGPGESIAHLSGRASRYLTHRGGTLTADVFHLVRTELHLDLRKALDAAIGDGDPVRSPPIPMSLDGEHRSVILRVYPARESHHDGFALVVFDEQGPDGSRPVEPPAHETDVEHTLRRELADARTRLEGALDQGESDEEEIRAVNERLTSVNEELRSTVEELAASQEELQSVNEELITLNEENRAKVEELSRLTSHLSMLMSSADIALVFLDRSLRIVRFTPRMEDLINLRSADVGRPLADLTHRFGTGIDFIADARGVLEDARPVQREVETAEGAWYLARTLPYRSETESTDGVVMTFVDITELKRSQGRLNEATRRLDILDRVAEDDAGTGG